MEWARGGQGVGRARSCWALLAWTRRLDFPPSAAQGHSRNNTTPSDTHLIGACCMPGTAPGAWRSSVNKAETSLPLWSVIRFGN